MYKLLLICSLISLSIFSRELYAQDITTLSVSPDQATSHKVKDLVKSIRYVRLQVPKDSFIGTYSKLLIEDDLIYILDNSAENDYKVHCFTLEGVFVYTLDKYGRGPGEYERIDDISFAGNMMALPAYPFTVNFYNRKTGAFIKKEEVPKDASIGRSIMLNEHTIALSSGRFQRNRSKHQFKIYDLKEKKYTYEAIPFEFHSLKLGSGYTRFFQTGNDKFYIPQFGKTIYKINDSGDSYNLVETYYLDFGKFWIPDNIVDNAYENRTDFFAANREYVHDPEIYKTNDLTYVYYNYKRKSYGHIFDRKSQKSVDISAYDDYSDGLISKPLATYKNWIIYKVSPYEMIRNKITPNAELKTKFDQTDEENRPILVFVEFSIK